MWWRHWILSSSWHQILSLHESQGSKELVIFCCISISLNTALTVINWQFAIFPMFCVTIFHLAHCCLLLLFYLMHYTCVTPCLWNVRYFNAWRKIFIFLYLQTLLPLLSPVCFKLCFLFCSYLLIHVHLIYWGVDLQFSSVNISSVV